MSTTLYVAKGAVTIISIGMPVLLAATGVIGLINVQSDSSDGAQIVFMGVYMFAFAATIFFYEMIQFCPNTWIGVQYQKNFGFMYGPIGRGLYLLL